MGTQLTNNKMTSLTQIIDLVRDVFEVYGVDSLASRAGSRRRPLKKGGYKKQYNKYAADDYEDFPKDEELEEELVAWSRRADSRKGQPSSSKRALKDTPNFVPETMVGMMGESLKLLS